MRPRPLEWIAVGAWRRFKLARGRVEYWRAVMGPLSSPSATSGAFAYDWFDIVLRRMELREPRHLRPSYSFGAVQAAYSARNLGYRRISLIEFGVAGGRGLVALDRLAPLLEEAFGLEVEVHGFDTGKGLPPPADSRDIPSMWSQGNYAMDEPALRARLKVANLHLGDVAATVQDFIASGPAPIAFIANDLDYYSSTIAALTVLDAPAELRLPRITCYFDDIIGFCCAPFNGELLAIEEFNAAHARRKLAVIPDLRRFLRRSWRHEGWPGQIYLAHDLDHPLYDRPDGMVLVPQLDVS